LGALDFPVARYDLFRMKIIRFAKPLLLVVLAFLTVPLASDALWDKASALVEASLAWYPKLTVALNEDIDGKGRVDSTLNTTTENGFDDKGRVTTKKLKVVKNGKEEKPDAVARATNAPKGPSDPLQATAQPTTKIQAAVDGEWKGIPVRIYPYSFLTKDGWGLKGRIWIDPVTAVPLHRESVMDPRAPFIDKVSFTQDSSLNSAGFVQTDRLSVDFEGSFLGLKKRFRNVSTYQNYVYR